MRLTLRPSVRSFGLVLAGVMMVACAQTAESRSQPHPTVNHAGFERWLEGVRAEALQQGISRAVVEEALSGVTVQEKVLKLDVKQPEKKINFPDYRTRVVTEKRIAQGRQMMQEYRTVLQEVESRFGVPARYIVALWGIETSYGEITGNFNIIEALATLAYEGRRAEFFRKELMDALRILDQDHIRVSDMKGSWAGAMGQSQFMPSSFLAYAYDFNGDGRRDIWQTEADVFASIANYLATRGWQGGEWGMAVELPSNFNRALLGRETKKTSQEWQSMGVRTVNGEGLPAIDRASIVQPDGSEHAYVVTPNYDIVMHWNRSLYFATSVGLLADALGE